jgi:hypothetical protein
MMSRLLTDEELREEFARLEKTYKEVNMPWFWAKAVSKAQDAKTLKAVGEWLESRLKQDISNFTQGFITLGDIDTLNRGEMP